MLSEELILHFIPKAFPGYFVKAKSLIRVTRNADIDADALYDEDLDYREFMVEVIKKRKRLAPVRLELSRELDGDIVDTLCDYLGVNKNMYFAASARWICPLYFRSRICCGIFRSCFMRSGCPRNLRSSRARCRSCSR